MVGDTGLEPVTSTVWQPIELIAQRIANYSIQRCVSHESYVDLILHKI